MSAHPAPRSEPAKKDKDVDERGDHPPPPPDLSLDPLARSLWSLAPLAPPPASVAPAASVVPAVLDDIVARMITRVAIAGDKRRGTSHLAIGAGELAGGAITLEVEGRAVRVRIDPPPGVDARAFAEGIRARLLAKGLEPAIEIT